MQNYFIITSGNGLQFIYDDKEYGIDEVVSIGINPTHTTDIILITDWTESEDFIGPKIVGYYFGATFLDKEFSTKQTGTRYYKDALSNDFSKELFDGIESKIREYLNK